MDIKNLLGKKIQSIRKQKGLTQEKFSELINISQRTLSGIESGKNFLTSQTLDKILEVFEITPDEIFKLSEFQPQKELKNRIINDLNTLSEDKLRMVYKFISSIK